MAATNAITITMIEPTIAPILFPPFQKTAPFFKEAVNDYYTLSCRLSL